MTPTSVKAVKAHFAVARRALLNADKAVGAAERSAFSEQARAEIELCRFYQVWPSSMPEYGELP